MPLSLGVRLGSDEVTAKIGKGVIGDVCEARDAKLDPEALKVPPPAFTDDSGHRIAATPSSQHAKTVSLWRPTFLFSAVLVTAGAMAIH